MLEGCMTILEKIIEREDLKSDLIHTIYYNDWFDCDFVDDISSILRREKATKEEIL